MKILVLTKRHYMGHDLLDERFGRFSDLPLELARRGHDITGVALNYRRGACESVVNEEGTPRGSLTWHSVNLRPGLTPRPDRYALRALRIASRFGPDLIWTCSDAYHAVFGQWLARSIERPCVIDLYDNFESFKATRFPGVPPLFKRAVRRAAGVTCVSRPLLNYVVSRYRRAGQSLLLENAIRPDLFQPRDRIKSRKHFDLPDSAVLIGTAGALDDSRGIDVLFAAHEILTRRRPNVLLVVAGPRASAKVLPRSAMIRDLGVLSHERVPTLFSALNVAVICNRDTAFGRYCFPQKAFEMIACRVPVVAAAVGATRDLLKDFPHSLYEPDNPNSLADAIERQLAMATLVDLPVPSWAELAARLEQFFGTLLGAAPAMDSTGGTSPQSARA